MNTLKQSLKDTFGFDDFRQGQEQTMTQLLRGESTLSIFPTGSGKSLCYQLTALHLPHLTLVVSPLLALMKDQLDFLKQKGISAASIDSSLKANEVQEVMENIRQGQIKILMVSVERFKNERFRQFIESVQVSMLVVDEAHCISEWGHNFRPDYLKLPAYRLALSIPLTLLLTATATREVKMDMANKFDIIEKHIVQTGFYRKNLDLSVIPVSSAEKTFLLAQKIKAFSGSGIVYVTLQHSAEMISAYLVKAGINAKPYHAGFSSEVRSEVQQDFMQGEVQVIVATIAFGMGIDKSDIRFVFHYDLPKSIENYSQEIGRAGRDGKLSHCITLANLDGLNTVENFVYSDTPEFINIKQVIETIKSNTFAQKWELLLLQLSNETNIKQLPLKTLLVQLELHGVIEPQYAYFADFKIKLLTPVNEILPIFNEQRQHFLKQIFKATTFKKIWGSLNFNDLLHDKSIDRQRVIAALEYLQAQQHIVLETTKMTEVFKVKGDSLANENLTEILHDYFIDKEEKEIQRIAHLIAFFQLDSCLNFNLGKYFDDPLTRNNAITACGHCSVCRGDVAHLTYSEVVAWPSDEILLKNAGNLKTHLSGKIDQPLSIESFCRFFAGMTVPLFGRNKVRQLPGFASCEKQRYHEIRHKLTRLLS
jgi:ATP-dependent DNA helicase RecQ